MNPIVKTKFLYLIVLPEFKIPLRIPDTFFKSRHRCRGTEYKSPYTENGYIPSIVLAAIADFFNITPGDIQISFGRMIKLIQAQLPDGSVRDISIPIDKQGRMYVHFAASYNQSFRYVPVRELLFFKKHFNADAHEWLDNDPVCPINWKAPQNAGWRSS